MSISSNYTYNTTVKVEESIQDMTGIYSYELLSSSETIYSGSIALPGILVVNITYDKLFIGINNLTLRIKTDDTVVREFSYTVTREVTEWVLPTEVYHNFIHLQWKPIIYSHSQYIKKIEIRRAKDTVFEYYKQYPITLNDTELFDYDVVEGSYYYKIIIFMNKPPYNGDIWKFASSSGWTVQDGSTFIWESDCVKMDFVTSYPLTSTYGSTTPYSFSENRNTPIYKSNENTYSTDVNGYAIHSVIENSSADTLRYLQNNFLKSRRVSSGGYVYEWDVSRDMNDLVISEQVMSLYDIANSNADPIFYPSSPSTQLSNMRYVKIRYRVISGDREDSTGTEYVLPFIGIVFFNTTVQNYDSAARYVGFKGYNYNGGWNEIVVDMYNSTYYTSHLNETLSAIRIDFTDSVGSNKSRILVDYIEYLNSSMGRIHITEMTSAPGEYGILRYWIGNIEHPLLTEYSPISEVRYGISTDSINYKYWNGSAWAVPNKMLKDLTQYKNHIYKDNGVYLIDGPMPSMKSLYIFDEAIDESNMLKLYPDTSLFNSKFTIEAWIKTVINVENRGVIYSDRYGNDPGGFQVEYITATATGPFLVSRGKTYSLSLPLPAWNPNKQVSSVFSGYTGDWNNYLDLTPGTWLNVDLENIYRLSSIFMIHYPDGRSYHDIIIQLSLDNINWTTVFNNDTDNSSGYGSGTDAEYTESISGKTITLGSYMRARYVRFFCNGSTANTGCHYLCIKIFAVPYKSIALTSPNTWQCISNGFESSPNGWDHIAIVRSGNYLGHQGYVGVENDVFNGESYNMLSMCSNTFGLNNMHYRRRSSSDYNVVLDMTYRGGGVYSGGPNDANDQPRIEIRADSIMMHPDNSGNHASLQWAVPRSGVIYIYCVVSRPSTNGNGTYAALINNTTLLTYTTISPGATNAVVSAEVFVNKGDLIGFDTSAIGEYSYDTTLWNITCTYLPETHKVYVNGEKLELFIDYPTTGRVLLPNTSVKTIGGSSFRGSIAEFRMWNKERTQAEIQANMNNRLSGNEEGLVCYPDIVTSDNIRHFGNTATELQNITQAQWAQLGSINTLYFKQWSKDNFTTQPHYMNSLILNLIPPNKYYLHSDTSMTINTSGWGTIEKIEIEQDEPVGSKIRYAFSFDGRNTWKVLNGAIWNTITLSNLVNGMTYNDLLNANYKYWILGGTMDIAVYMESDSESVVPILDGIIFTYTEGPDRIYKEYVQIPVPEKGYKYILIDGTYILHRNPYRVGGMEVITRFKVSNNRGYIKAKYDTAKLVLDKFTDPITTRFTVRQHAIDPVKTKFNVVPYLFKYRIPTKFYILNSGAGIATTKFNVLGITSNTVLTKFEVLNSFKKVTKFKVKMNQFKAMDTKFDVVTIGYNIFIM